MIDRISERTVELLRRELKTQHDRAQKSVDGEEQSLDATIALAYIKGKTSFLNDVIDEKNSQLPDGVLTGLMANAKKAEDELRSGVVKVIKRTNTSETSDWPVEFQQYVAGLELSTIEAWAVFLGAQKMRDRLGLRKSGNGITTEDSSREFARHVQTAVIKVLGEVVSLGR